MVLLGLMTLVVCGCTSSGPSHLAITVHPASTTLFDQPVRIQVGGLSPGQAVSVRLSSVDSHGVRWSSHAVFRADGRGVLDLSRSPARSGSYRGVNPMGLIESLQPGSPLHSDPAYSWGPAPRRFTLTVSAAGSITGHKSFSRRASSPGVRAKDETLRATGFYGQYWLPAPGSPRRPALLAFGGSEGGLGGQLLGAGLASAGYPVLNIAYFGAPGLPAQLKNIPLEYFARALRWLARQPQVLAHDIWVSGFSRGSEAALLLGAHYPSLVHGVIASSPSDIAFGADPGPGAAWTFHGRPVPFSLVFSTATPVVDPAADIAVQKISGPVFLDCGTYDQTWTSCAYAAAIQRRLSAAHDRYPHILYRYTGAGHLAGSLVPYEPYSTYSLYTSGAVEGATPLANASADASLWPHLLAFLAHHQVLNQTVTLPATPPPAARP